MTRKFRLILLAATIFARPALAGSQRIDLPAGAMGDAIIALGRQTGASISVDDPSAWNRKVPAVRGQMTTREALTKLAQATATTVRRAGSNGWRVIARKPISRRIPLPAAPTVQQVSAQASEAADIVVTASKRDVRFQDFAGQVTSISGADLGIEGPAGTDAILARLASVSSTHLGSGRNKLFIRGIADSSFTGPTQATVGQYLGDIRLSYNAPDPDLRLHDIASVEVLEGPQGTLYGAGSLGGIIRAVPNTPDFTTSASVLIGGSATEHGDPGADISATLNVPISDDRIALRLVGYGEADGGYIDNPMLRRNDINRTSVVGGRGTLRLVTPGGWTIDLGGLAQSTLGDDSQYADRDALPLTRNSLVAQGFAADYALGQVAVGGDIGGLRLRSTTGVSWQTLSERYDATPFGGVPVLLRQQNATRMITNETRLWQPMRDGFGWLIGASATHNRSSLARAAGPPDGLLAPSTGVSNELTEITLYGEASLALLRGLVVTGGTRITVDWLSGKGEDVAPAVAAARAMVTASRHELSVLPSVSLIATVLPHTSLYARYQQGFRPGGLAIEADFVRRFEGDRVQTLETGLRYGRPDRGSLFLTFSIAHTIWNSIQADFIDSAGLPSTANIGDGRIWTFSTAGNWRPAQGLTIDLGFSYNDSRITAPSPALALSLARQSQIPNVAKIAGRLGVDYRQGFGEDLTLRVNAWARYVGTSRLGIGPVLGETQGDYLDTALSARIGRPSVGVALGVTNLADSVGNRFALGTPFQTGRGQITPLRPRTMRLALDVSF